MLLLDLGALIRLEFSRPGLGKISQDLRLTTHAIDIVKVLRADSDCLLMGPVVEVAGLPSTRVLLPLFLLLAPGCHRSIEKVWQLRPRNAVDDLVRCVGITEIGGRLRRDVVGSWCSADGRGQARPGIFGVADQGGWPRLRLLCDTIV